MTGRADELPGMRWVARGHPLTSLWIDRLAHLGALSYELRADPRWVRFHSLPGSRRYPAAGPAGADDWAELLHRHKTLIGELTAIAPAGHLYRPVWPHDDLASADNDRWLTSGLDWQDWALCRDRGDEEAPWVTLVTAAVDWPAPWADAWLRATAIEELGMGVLVAADGSWLAAPYDGGIDLVPPDDHTATELLARHAAWRPVHGDL